MMFCTALLAALVSIAVATQQPIALYNIDPVDSANTAAVFGFLGAGVDNSGDGPGFGSWVVYHPGNAGNAGKARNTGTVGSSEKPFFMTVLCNATIGNPPWFLARDLARSVLDS